MFAHVGHGVELLLTDLTGELLLSIAMDDLVVLMEGPELLEPLPTRHALQEERGWVGKQGNMPRTTSIFVLPGYQLHPLKGDITVKPTAKTSKIIMTSKSATDLVTSKPPKLKISIHRMRKGCSASQGRTWHLYQQLY